MNRVDGTVWCVSPLENSCNCLEFRHWTVCSRPTLYSVQNKEPQTIFCLQCEFHFARSSHRITLTIFRFVSVYKSFQKTKPTISWSISQHSNFPTLTLALSTKAICSDWRCTFLNQPHKYCILFYLKEIKKSLIAITIWSLYMTQTGGNNGFAGDYFQWQINARFFIQTWRFGWATGGQACPSQVISATLLSFYLVVIYLYHLFLSLGTFLLY